MEIGTGFKESGHCCCICASSGALLLPGTSVSISSRGPDSACVSSRVPRAHRGGGTVGCGSQRLCVTGALCLFWKTFLHQDLGTAGSAWSCPLLSHPIPSHLSYAVPSHQCHLILSFPSHFTPSPSPAVGPDLGTPHSQELKDHNTGPA